MRIWLTLSGGGFRATAYHLGALWVLERLGLLNEVAGLSTASGGTLLAARYLRALRDGVAFETFFDETARYLLGRNVVAEAAENLSRRAPEDARAPTLIVGAADVYAKTDFCGDMTFGDVLTLKSPLEEINLNATEFHGGLAFRFLRSARPAMFGNGKIEVPEQLVPQIRLADVAAASAAFPGGFEPIAFPHDFVWGADRAQALAALPDPIPLMDGGIVDNQGVDSLALALRRGAQPPELLLVSDVNLWDEPFYEVPKPLPGVPLRLAELVALGAGAGLFAVVAALLSLAALVHGWEGGVWFRVLTGVPLVLSSTVALAVGLIGWHGWKIVEPYWKNPKYRVADYWRDLSELRLGVAARLLDLRGGSLLALATKVWMKRVRKSVQSDAIQAFGPSTVAWSSIYALSRDNPGHYPGTQRLISPEALRCAEAANAMPTILWARTAYELRSVIATGRLITCTALLEWIDREAVRAPMRARVEALLDTLDADPLAGIPSHAHTLE
jgi:predicted acylesterase/phospholipase RssA